MDGKEITVLVVDDHPAVQDALANTIHQQDRLRLGGVARTALQALEKTRVYMADVAGVDISLDDAHGLDLGQNLRARYPALQVVSCSM
jgi:DNA-binding NarL/FixJ family response regulator